ncbi:MAG: hypothetical protein LV479_02675 [Methylacidiphilales bacterium]|nr:hypothetical protein [Candidatus Methylacidiphilales bacterium]
MNTLRLDITYRPFRIGWAIRKGDIEAFRQAVRLSYCLWGGRFNPVLVIDDVEQASALVDAFRVDFIHPIQDDSESKEFVKQFPHLLKPFLAHGIISRGSGEEGHAQILDVVNAMAHSIHKPEWEALKKEGVRVYSWSPDDPLADMFLVQYGAYPDPAEIGIDYRKMLIQAASASEHVLDPRQPIPVDAVAKPSIAWLSRHGLERHYRLSSLSGAPGFFVGSARQLDDLITFWNLRAADIGMLFIDHEQLDRFTLILPEWEKRTRETVAVRNEFDRYVAVRFPENLSKQAQSIFPGADMRFMPAWKDMWSEPRANAPLMYLGSTSVLGIVDQEKGPPRVTFPLSEKPFSDDIWFHTQHLVASVLFFGGLFGDDRHTFNPPYLPELNDFCAREMHFDPSRARLEPESIGIAIHPTDTDSSLSALSAASLTKKIFEKAGFETELSSGGLIARQLVSHLGGLQGARVLKIPGVRSLIDTYGPNDTFNKRGALQLICQRDPSNPAASFKDYEGLFIEPRPFDQKLRPPTIFSFLVEKGLFRQGVRVNCPTCNLFSWVSVNNLKQQLTCDLCGHVHDATRQLVDCDWQYRRSGILGVERNVMGAIPVVLTLQQLETNMGAIRGNHLYSMSLNFRAKEKKDARNFEFDFVLFVPRIYPERTAVLLGECKSTGPINAEDIENFQTVATALPAKYFEVFLVASKLSSFTPEEIDLLKGLQPRVILLTSRELEPYHIYDRVPEGLGINAWGGSVEDLCQATSKLFFAAAQGGSGK